jgi:hypothetical protein
MPAIEIIAFTLGGAIAKALLKQYASDSWFELGKDLIEHLTTQGVKTAEQRKASQRIDTIAAQVTQGLFTFFDHEGAALSPQQRGVVAIELSRTLELAQIDSALLIQYRHDPPGLANHLLEARPDATRDLPEAGNELYRRFFPELAPALIKVAPELEDYEKEFQNTALDNLDLILAIQRQQAEILAQLLDLVRRLAPPDIEYYEKDLAIAQETGDRRGEGVHLGNLGSPTPTWAK